MVRSQGRRIPALVSKALQQAAAQPAAQQPAQQQLRHGLRALEGQPAQQQLQQLRGKATAAPQTRTAAAATETQQHQMLSVPVHEITTSLYGSVSAVSEGDQVEEGVFKNVDGHRFEDGRCVVVVGAHAACTHARTQARTHACLHVEGAAPAAQPLPGGVWLALEMGGRLVP